MRNYFTGTKVKANVVKGNIRGSYGTDSMYLGKVSYKVAMQYQLSLNGRVVNWHGLNTCTDYVHKVHREMYKASNVK